MSTSLLVGDVVRLGAAMQCAPLVGAPVRRWDDVERQSGGHAREEPRARAYNSQSACRIEQQRHEGRGRGDAVRLSTKGRLRRVSSLTGMDTGRTGPHAAV